jgi:predicted RNase H-like nuclease (RuvC/YqgF family)
MARQQVTRVDLRRALALNAVRSWPAIAAGGVLLLAAVVLGTWWLVVLALLVYAGMAAATFFDGAVAERVGRRIYDQARAVRASPRELPQNLRPEVVDLLSRARIEEDRIRAAIADSGAAFAEVSTEVEALAAEMEQMARRAHVVAEFLHGTSANDLRYRLEELRRPRGDERANAVRERAAAAVEDQLRVHRALQSDLERFRAEMEHLIASLGVIHGQLVRASVSADATRQESLAADVRALRGRIGDLAEALRGPDGST